MGGRLPLIFREGLGMLIYGVRPVLEALESRGRRVEKVFLQEGARSRGLNQILQRCRAGRIPFQFLSREALKRKAETDRHQGVAAQLSEADYLDLESLLETRPRFLLLADGVQDPRNLGALLRTAEAVGVQGVLLPERRSCGLTSTVVKASAGAALHLRMCRIGNVAQSLQRLKSEGFWVVGLDMAGEQGLENVPYERSLAIVVGGEQQGLRRLVREQCDQLVSLPMLGRVSSLNLSVAAAVLLYQVLLRRAAGAGEGGLAEGDPEVESGSLS